MSIVVIDWISYVGNVAVFMDQRNNVCTRCPLLLLIGSRMLETWWFLWIRETECVHKMSFVVIENVVGFMDQRK